MNSPGASPKPRAGKTRESRRAAIALLTWRIHKQADFPSVCGELGLAPSNLDGAVPDEIPKRRTPESSARDSRDGASCSTLRAKAAGVTEGPLPGARCAATLQITGHSEMVTPI